ncbi:SMI1/KNR4 family protein [Snodgrassella alvi]|nr:SMI1/KNR4 family protein [Snodgrassella alvi]
MTVGEKGIGKKEQKIIKGKMMKHISKNDVINLIEQNQDLVDFGTAEDAVSTLHIKKAEDFLGLPFTDSYKWFLNHYARGSICGDEIFSLNDSFDYYDSYDSNTDILYGEDIVYNHIVNLKNKLTTDKQLAVCHSDIDGEFFFDYTKYENNECPIYIYWSKDESIFYAQNFLEFLYKRIKECQ